MEALNRDGRSGCLSMGMLFWFGRLYRQDIHMAILLISILCLLVDLDLISILCSPFALDFGRHVITCPCFGIVATKLK